VSFVDKGFEAIHKINKYIKNQCSKIVSYIYLLVRGCLLKACPRNTRKPRTELMKFLWLFIVENLNITIHSISHRAKNTSPGKLSLSALATSPAGSSKTCFPLFEDKTQSVDKQKQRACASLVP
jgi:hypothetical protein